MSARDYSKFSPALWRSPRYRGLPLAGQLLHIYLMMNEHMTSAGCYRLPDGYACADLDWTADTYVANRSALVDAGLIDFDSLHDEVLVERWFKHNPPMNDKHALGTKRLIEAIESDRLREKTEAEFLEADTIRQDRQTRKAFEKASSKPESVIPTSNLLQTRMMGGRR